MKETTGKIDFFQALTLLFIALKLAGFIDWSWVWVLFPTWIFWALTAVILVIGYAKMKLSKRRPDDVKVSNKDLDKLIEMLAKLDEYED